MDFTTRWREYFKALDANNNGFLEPADAIIVAKEISKRLGLDEKNAAELQQAQLNVYSSLVADADKNKDGKVSSAEFDAFVLKAFKGKNYEEIPAWFRNNLEAAAKNFDLDQDGIISLEEWKIMNASYPKHASDSELTAAFTRVAKGNGLDLAGFKHAVWLWCVSEEPVPDLEIIFPFFQRQW